MSNGGSSTNPTNVQKSLQQEQILDLICGREPNNQEASIVEPSIYESIKEPLEEQLHSHCLIDDNLSQYSSHLNLDSDFDEINQTSVEEQSCGHSVLKSMPVRGIGKLKPNLLMFFLI